MQVFSAVNPQLNKNVTHPNINGFTLALLTNEIQVYSRSLLNSAGVHSLLLISYKTNT